MKAIGRILMAYLRVFVFLAAISLWAMAMLVAHFIVFIRKANRWLP